MFKPKILVVEDEKELADLYWTWLNAEHDTYKAYSGTEALETVNDTFDIVFLDRRIPDLNGGEVLAKMRERGLDCWVVMVTAVDPSEQIVDMEFDAYLSKPVSREDLVTTVEEINQRSEYNEHIREYMATLSKIEVLNESMEETRRESSLFYSELVEHADSLKEEITTTFNHIEGSVVNLEEIDLSG